jgi:long-chain acyl-CoA synthetase
MKNSEIKIDAPDSEGVGEVLIRGEMLMKGYLNNSEANHLAFTDDGWFRSGDLGKFDEQNNLYIVGRKKEVIILPSGKNVYPEDVEAHYAKSPVVGEICVLGVKDKSAEHAGAEKLFAVVVPDFEYMKQNNINNSLDMVRWTFDDLSREIPEYQRIKDYIVRAEPLPRTPTRKIQRFQLLKQLEQTGELEKSRTETKTWNFTEEDKILMSSNIAQLLSQAVKNHNAEIAEIHPNMNVELDLGLDSLARAECIAVLEQNLGIEFEAEKVATALTFGETVKLAQTLAPHAEKETSLVAESFNWGRIVTETKDDMPEVKAVLKDNFLWFTVALVVMRLIYVIARIFFRLELKGLENLTKIEKPFIVCPNHQSYLDAFFVCAVYPRSILKDTFHVGAKMFFEGSLSQHFPKLLKIVPIDPDVQLLKAMKAGAIGLRKGKILNIYPEGERAYDGNLHPFKKGAAILASELDLPIVPVAIDGFYKVWARNSNKINFAQIKIHFGEPFDWKQAVSENLEAEARYDAVTQALKQKIQRMLDEMRK